MATSHITGPNRTDPPQKVEATRIMHTPAPRAPAYVTRSRAYCFVLDDRGEPIELGSGRYAKAYLGEESWIESKTALKRQVAIKILQRGVNGEDALRFQVEKDLLERVQGHPNIITLHASGEGETPEFVPQSLRNKVANDFMILEFCDISLEERFRRRRVAVVQFPARFSDFSQKKPERPRSNQPAAPRRD